MTSKNWPGEFARACVTISLFLSWPLAAQTQRAAAPVKTPAVALLDSDDWQNWKREPGWQVIGPGGAPGADIDSRVRALAAAVENAIRSEERRVGQEG